MIKKIVYFLFFFIFFYNKPAHASSWYKYKNNPILPFSSSSSQYYSNPSILYDGEKYRMWVSKYFSNQWVIGYLESSNGIEWIETNNHVVLYPTNENGINELGVFEPFVLKKEKYYLWYNAFVNNLYYIRRATSDNGINWVKDPQFAIVGEKNWENRGVAHPSVLYLNDKYYLWYAGWGNSGWQLGLATSENGKDWIKELNNPLNLPINLGHVGGFYVEYINNQFQIYYHTGGAYATDIFYAVSLDGKNWRCPNSDCIVLNLNGEGNNRMIIGPHLARIDNQTYLYYTLSDNQNWSIGIAGQQPINIPSPSPTPPTLTPTPTPETSFIIIPGLFASWNKEALLHNKEVAYNQWKLPSFVHEYEGLIKTLKNLGKKENEDFFIFSYDWRKSLESIADDLKNFINEKIPQDNYISFIGHSLGGLVSRIYTQKYSNQRVKKLITVGSPHYGAIQVYKPLSAGEIDRENTFFWLAEKLTLILNKDSFETDRETLRKKFPVAFDLLPLFDFLIDDNNQLISTKAMSLKNPTLLKYNFSFPQIYPIFTAIYGGEIQTPSFYKITQPNPIDNILGNYLDGRPIELKKESGDGTVLLKSAYEKDDEGIKFDSLNHGEIIYKKEPIKKILNLLDVSFQDDSIVEGRGTKISPSLIFLIRSPATIEVIGPNNKIYQEEEGIIFIENAQKENYQLKVKGIEKGDYQIIIGKVFEENDVWEKINGEITSDNPEKEIDYYLINFSQITPTLTPVSTSSNQTNNQISLLTNNSSADANQTNDSNTIQSSAKTNNSLDTANNKNRSSSRLISQLKTSKEEVKGATDIKVNKKKNVRKKNFILLILFFVIGITLIFFIAKIKQNIKNSSY